MLWRQRLVEMICGAVLPKPQGKGTFPPVVGLVVRLILALSLAFAPASMAIAMARPADQAVSHAGMTKDDCPGVPSGPAKRPCAAFCLAGLANLDGAAPAAPRIERGMVHSTLSNIGEGLSSKVATPPPRSVW